jgi:DNA polymerase elongation subunit (family B)
MSLSQSMQRDGSVSFQPILVYTPLGDFEANHKDDASKFGDTRGKSSGLRIPGRSSSRSDGRVDKTSRSYGYSCMRLGGTTEDGRGVIWDIIGVPVEICVRLPRISDKPFLHGEEDPHCLDGWDNPTVLTNFVEERLFKTRKAKAHLRFLERPYRVIARQPTIGYYGKQNFPYLRLCYQGTRLRQLIAILKQPVFIPGKQYPESLEICDCEFDPCVRYFPRIRLDEKGQETASPFSWFFLPVTCAKGSVRYEPVDCEWARPQIVKGVFPGADLHVRSMWIQEATFQVDVTMQGKIAPHRCLSFDIETFAMQDYKEFARAGDCLVSSIGMVDFTTAGILAQVVLMLRSSSIPSPDWLTTIHSRMGWVSSTLEAIRTDHNGCCPWDFETERPIRHVVPEYEARSELQNQFGKIRVEYFDSEAELLIRFFELWHSTLWFEITGFNIDGYDLGMIWDRAERLGILRHAYKLGLEYGENVQELPERISRAKGSNAIGIVEKNSVRIPGRVVVDMYPILRKNYSGKVSRYGLADFSKVVLNDSRLEKLDMDHRQQFLMWILGAYDRELEYVAQDALLPAVMMNKIALTKDYIARGAVTKASLRLQVDYMQTKQVLTALNPKYEERGHVLSARNMSSYLGIPWTMEVERRFSKRYLVYDPMLFPGKTYFKATEDDETCKELTRLHNQTTDALIDARNRDYAGLASILFKKHERRGNKCVSKKRVMINTYNFEFWEMFITREFLAKVGNRSGGFVVDIIQMFLRLPISTIDARALYPSIIDAFNLCFTIVLTDYRMVEFCKRNKIPITEKQVRSDGVIHLLKKQVPGVEGISSVFASVVLEVLRLRGRYKNEVKRCHDQGLYEDEELNKLMEAAVKAQNNSFYGFLLRKNGDMFNFPLLGELIPRLGQEILKRVRAFIQIDHGIGPDYVSILYGDTDSVMFTFYSHLSSYMKEHGMAETVVRMWQLTKAMVDKINWYVAHHYDPCLEFAIEKVMAVSAFLCKKLYVSQYLENEKTPWTQQHYITHKGSFAARGDTVHIVAKLGKKTMEGMIRHCDPQKLHADYLDDIATLLCEELSYEECCMVKRLGSYCPYHVVRGNMKTYDPARLNDPAFAAVRLSAIDRSLAPAVNTKISYFIEKYQPMEGDDPSVQRVLAPSCLRVVSLDEVTQNDRYKRLVEVYGKNMGRGNTYLQPSNQSRVQPTGSSSSSSSNGFRRNNQPVYVVQGSERKENKDKRIQNIANAKTYTCTSLTNQNIKYVWKELPDAPKIAIDRIYLFESYLKKMTNLMCALFGAEKAIELYVTLRRDGNGLAWRGDQKQLNALNIRMAACSTDAQRRQVRQLLKQECIRKISSIISEHMFVEWYLQKEEVFKSSLLSKVERERDQAEQFIREEEEKEAAILAANGSDVIERLDRKHQELFHTDAPTCLFVKDEDANEDRVNDNCEDDDGALLNKDDDDEDDKDEEEETFNRLLQAYTRNAKKRPFSTTL